MADQTSGVGVGQLVSNLPTGRFKDELKNAAGAYAERGLHALADKVGGKSDGGGNGGGKKKSGAKVTNIVEDITIGVPVRVAYNQWTQFRDWPGFMKKVEQADQKEENRLALTAKVFWSRRTWEATIVEQVPDNRIVWSSAGPKGHVDGTVTFHEVGPNLTRILVVLEYHPHGFFEKTGNIWRAQGRRARLELKHFRRHVMRSTLLDPDSVEGWRGEIRDGEVVRTHEEVLEDEGYGEGEDGEDEAGEDEDGYDEEAPEDEEPEDELPEDELPEDEEEEPYDEDEDVTEDEEELAER